MHSKILQLSFLFLLAVSACEYLPVVPAAPEQSSTAAIMTPSLTPFQPATLTNVYEIQVTGTETPTPEPSPTSSPEPSFPTQTITRLYPTLQRTPISTQTPPPAELIPKADGQVSVLLLGSDQISPSSNPRTDIIMLATVKPDGLVTIVSVPRDLYVFVPGFRMSRINAAYVWGGFDLLAMTFEYNFGILPDYYVLVNLRGFKTIVDSLGGIDVNVIQTLHDERDDYPEHSDAYPDGFTVHPGLVHMDGATALWYARSRKTTSDLDRIRRSQDVVIAIGKKLLSLDAINHIPDLYLAYHQTVDTDLSLDDLLGFVPLVIKVNPNQVERYPLTIDQVVPWVDPVTKAQYLLPKTDPIRQVFLQAVGYP